MANPRTNLALALALFAGGGPVYGFELQTGVGREVIVASDILPETGGQGNAANAHLLWSPKSLPVGLGLALRYEGFHIASADDEDVTKDGRLQGIGYGLSFVTKANWGPVSPYARASYLRGFYDYDLEASSTGSYNATQLTTELTTQIDFSAETLSLNGGFRFGGEWGGFIEYGLHRTLLTVSRAAVNATNTVDGEVASQDGGEESISELFQTLVGEIFHHSTSSITLGVSWRP